LNHAGAVAADASPATSIVSEQLWTFHNAFVIVGTGP
jgi:hypothetical protein